MDANARFARYWWTAAALVAAGVTAGCSIYQPLGHGSRVPWAGAQLAAAERASAPRTASTVAAVMSADERYRVRRGDRLGDLARSFKVSVADLARANNLAAPYTIRTGQELRIPAHARGGAPAPTVVAARSSAASKVASIRVSSGQPVRTVASQVTATADPTKVAALEVKVEPSAGPKPTPELKPEKAVSRPAVAGFGADRYTVGSGDTLSGIAGRLDVPMSELAKANDLSKPYRVYAGQKLRLPKSGGPETTTVKLGQDRGSVRLATGEPPPLSGDGFSWPVNGKVIGAFGPIDQWRRRDGIDIAARRGAPVQAAQDGIVAYAGDGIPGYGQMILLRHDQGYITTYAHNATLLVQVGEVVRRDQVIARVGDTGEVGQTMLHFELRKGRTPIDPQTRLVSDATTVASSTQSSLQ